MTVRCDFCSSPDVKWSYPCPSFRMTVLGIDLSNMHSVKVPWGSDGNWLACPACKALIDSGDRAKLSRRSAKRMAAKRNLSIAAALQLVTPLHKEFFAHRMGDPIPYQQEKHHADPPL